MWNKLEQIEKRWEELNAEMAKPEVATNPQQLMKLAQEKSSLDEIVNLYRDYKTAGSNLDQTQKMLDDKLDADMTVMVKDEIRGLEEKRARLQEDMKRALLPKDPNDERNIILEIRAGTGGDEAAIFASDLFRMYTRYAQAMRWEV